MNTVTVNVAASPQASLMPGLEIVQDLPAAGEFLEELALAQGWALTQSPPLATDVSDEDKGLDAALLAMQLQNLPPSLPLPVLGPAIFSFSAASQDAGPHIESDAASGLSLVTSGVGLLGSSAYLDQVPVLSEQRLAVSGEPVLAPVTAVPVPVPLPVTAQDSSELQSIDAGIDLVSTVPVVLAATGPAGDSFVQSTAFDTADQAVVVAGSQPLGSERPEMAETSGRQVLSAELPVLMKTTESLAFELAPDHGGEMNVKPFMSAADADAVVAVSTAVAVAPNVAGIVQALDTPGVSMVMGRTERFADNTPGVQGIEVIQSDEPASQKPGVLVPSDTTAIVVEEGYSSGSPVAVTPQAVQPASGSFASVLLNTQTLSASQETPAPLEPHLMRLDTGTVQVEILRLVQQGGGQIVMEVAPPDQGKYRIDLRIDAKGEVSLVVDGLTDSARTRMEQGESGLREQFSQMGLSLHLDLRGQTDRHSEQQVATADQDRADFSDSINSVKGSNPLAKSAQRVDLNLGHVHLYA